MSKLLVLAKLTTSLIILYWGIGLFFLILAIMSGAGELPLFRNDYFDDHFILAVLILSGVSAFLSLLGVIGSKLNRKLFLILLAASLLLTPVLTYVLNPFCNEVVDCGSNYVMELPGFFTN